MFTRWWFSRGMSSRPPQCSLPTSSRSVNPALLLNMGKTGIKDGHKAIPQPKIPFLIILAGSLRCVLHNRRKQPQRRHVRSAFNLSLNCSRVSAEAGSCRNAAQRSSNIPFASAETSNASNSGATDIQSSSTSCSFSRADKAPTAKIQTAPFQMKYGI